MKQAFGTGYLTVFFFLLQYVLRAGVIGPLP